MGVGFEFFLALRTAEVVGLPHMYRPVLSLFLVNAHPANRISRHVSHLHILFDVASCDRQPSKKGSTSYLVLQFFELELGQFQCC